MGKSQNALGDTVSVKDDELHINKHMQFKKES